MMKENDDLSSYVKDKEHYDFILDNLYRLKPPYPKEYLSLFFLLGLVSNAKGHIEQLFDFENRCVKDLEEVDLSWATHTDLKLIALAYNLFTWKNSLNNDILDYNLASIFSVDSNVKELMFNAIRLNNL